VYTSTADNHNKKEGHNHSEFLTITYGYGNQMLAYGLQPTSYDLTFESHGPEHVTKWTYTIYTKFFLTKYFKYFVHGNPTCSLK